MNYKAIYAIYPNVVTIDGTEGAFDKDGNKVEIDLDKVEIKAKELEDKSKSEVQAKEAAKQAAETKLAKLGLTPEDLKALLG
jgi:hypothetical protein